MVVQIVLIHVFIFVFITFTTDEKNLWQREVRYCAQSHSKYVERQDPDPRWSGSPTQAVISIFCIFFVSFQKSIQQAFAEVMTEP